MNFTLTLVSHVSPLFCLMSLRVHTVCERAQKQKMTRGSKLFLEFISKHNSGNNLLWRYTHFHEKNHHTTFFKLLIRGIFESQFIRMNA